MNTENQLLLRALQVIEINHGWHKEYDDVDGYLGSDLYDHNVNAIRAIKTALTQPAQAGQPAEGGEAVAEVDDDICSDHKVTVYALAYLPRGTKLYTAPPARQEQALKPLNGMSKEAAMEWLENLRRPPELEQQPMCKCGDRPASQCGEEWGPTCDLGNNAKHAKVASVQQPSGESYSELFDALQEIDTAAVFLPGFKVTHEGGIGAVVKNIIEAMQRLSQQSTRLRGGVPGWQWVPVEPTPEMLKAGHGSISCVGSCGEASPPEVFDFYDVWDAMLAARPTTPPKEQV